MDKPTKASKVTTTSARVHAAKKAAKPKPLPVRLIFVLDRSGSMESMRTNAIEAFNRFLRDQQELPGQATFSFVTFNTDVNVHYDLSDLDRIPPLSRETYRPNGGTALYDALGLTINRYKFDKAKVKTIMAVMTDGEENSSRQYTGYGVKKLIEEVQEELKWEVLFLGANLDSDKFAQSVGIKLNNVSNYDYTSKGMLDGIGTLSNATALYRGVTGSIGGEEMNASNVDMKKLYTATASATFNVTPGLTVPLTTGPTVTSTSVPDGTKTSKKTKKEQPVDPTA